MPLFPPMVAFDGTGAVVRSAAGRVYAESDTQFQTPLAVTDIFGNALPNNDVFITDLGTTIAFRTATLFEVVWKSGNLPPIPISSPQGAREAAEAARAATEQALLLVQAAAASAATSASLVGAPADDVMAAVIRSAGSATRDALGDVFAVTDTGGLSEAGIVTLIQVTNSSLRVALDAIFVTQAELTAALSGLSTGGGGVDEASLVTLVNDPASSISVALKALYGQRVMYVNKTGTTWGARPTADPTVKVFWTGALPQPTPVTSGTGGMHVGQDVYFLRPAT